MRPISSRRAGRVRLAAMRALFFVCYRPKRSAGKDRVNGRGNVPSDECGGVAETRGEENHWLSSPFCKARIARFYSVAKRQEMSSYIIYKLLRCKNAPVVGAGRRESVSEGG